MSKRKNNIIKKIGMTAAIILILGIFFTACADKKDEEKKVYKIDPAALSAELQEKVKFERKLEEIDKDVLEMYYTIDEGTTVVAFIAGSALADEITIFTSKDEASAKKMYDNAKTHIKERTDLFDDYAPAEVEKLNKAVVVQKGVYTVVCVTSDADNAKSIINKAF